jgi:signal transduction histidine kinase
MALDWNRVARAAASLLLITAAYYSIPSEQKLASSVAHFLFFLPIALSAFWFGIWGGFVAALAATVCYLPRVVLFLRESPRYSVEQYGEALDLVLVGSVLGWLADRERAINRRLQESQESLRRAERMSAIGQLAANLAHEIRNPLASIEGAADLLKPGALPADAQGEFVGIIKAESRRLNRLLTRMLDYARQRPPSTATVAVSEIVNSAADLLSVVAGKARSRIEVECDPHMPPLRCDPEQIKQVMVNLVMNAVQAMPDGGLVKISAHHGSRRTLIEVADQGVGIAASEVDKLFSPFYTTKKEGTGLGLAISQHIVAQHGGQIRVRPNQPSGTVFTVDLPDRTQEAR